jgi:HEAT repeat protein
MKVVFLFASALAVYSQQPRVSNARPETRAVTGGLEATFQAIQTAQASPAWVGYAEPIVTGNRQSCCWNDGGGCFLEHRSGNRGVTVAAPQIVKLEGPTHLVILLRVENHQIERIRTLTPECDVDAGGLPFIWLTGVGAPESIRLLLLILKSAPGATRDDMRISDSAVAAIALHSDPAADTALEELADSKQPEKLRRQAIFWLPNAHGRRGFEVVNRIVKQDPSDKIRESAVFALAESNEPEALSTVVGVAHNDPSPRVRGQALFWLAQKAEQKMAEASIRDAIANDPETEVKKRAVFALTQMPNGEGVPMLIQVARTNRNPEVRKQAVFWLGQSKDTRALTFIEDVLK